MKIKMLLCILVCLMLLTACSSGKTGDMQLSQPDATTPEITTPEITTPASQRLQPGYYVAEKYIMGELSIEGEDLDGMRMYLLLEEGGAGRTGLFGATSPLTWDDKQITMEGAKLAYSVENGVLSLIYDVDSITIVFHYVGDQLPEGFTSPIPVGYFAVSSVGRNGDISFYGTIDPENGYIRIREDNTGEMFFDGQLRSFTLEEGILHFDTEQAAYRYFSADASGDGEAMLMVGFEGDTVLTIAFRPAEDPEKS